MDIRFLNLEALKVQRDDVEGDTMLGRLRKLGEDDKGATAVEYGLILALVVLAAMSAMVKLGGSTISMWNNVTTAVTNA